MQEQEQNELDKLLDDFISGLDDFNIDFTLPEMDMDFDSDLLPSLDLDSIPHLEYGKKQWKKTIYGY